MELFCANGDCGKEVIGRGVLAWDPVGRHDWEEAGIKNVLVFTDGEGVSRQALVLHLICFNEVFDQIARSEDGYVLTIVVGGVRDFKKAMIEDEEEE